MVKLLWLCNHRTIILIWREQQLTGEYSVQLHFFVSSWTNCATYVGRYSSCLFWLAWAWACCYVDAQGGFVAMTVVTSVQLIHVFFVIASRDCRVGALCLWNPCSCMVKPSVRKVQEQGMVFYDIVTAQVNIQWHLGYVFTIPSSGSILMRLGSMHWHTIWPQIFL